MIRLHEFVTKIRNCKTIAQERAQYQKEMAAIRESFAKNQQSLRPRNMTKLLFINMSGQQTNFGQMECLRLISANSLIEKRIGYLGLTQLFDEKSELLMMATNRIRVDLTSNNVNIVGLALCVLSEICTAQLSKELNAEVLKCIGNGSASIKKKAILTGIKIIKKSPQYIPNFLPKVASCLDQKNHGVLLSCMAFLQNVIFLDEGLIGDLVELVPKIVRAYRMVIHETNSDYEIGGVQDPFLQVAILRFLRYLRKHSDKFQKQLAQTLVLSHDSICVRITGNLKNGANAVLLQCFQCFMLMEPTSHARQLVSNVLSKFISIKDANSKYLSLFNLSLIAKYDFNIAKNHKSTIIECLNENDILIRVMALDLIYIIASPDNVNSIIKQLLNTLLTAKDQQFISELALKICLIVQKHSQSRRWHFDTILKVLILADQSVKEESAKSLVHLITSTSQLQKYSMAKLFFATSQNPQNDTLCKITLYLLGQLGQILPRINQIQISQANIINLVQQIVFRAGVANDTISYGLSTLLKLFDKFTDKTRIKKMIQSFEAHSDLEVQKRACEYSKLLDASWDQDRKKEICIPIPVFKNASDTFRTIPIGDTQLQLDLSSLKMPEKINIDYDQHIPQPPSPSKLQDQRDIKVQQKKSNMDSIFDVDSHSPTNPTFEQKKQPTSSLMDDDIFSSLTGGSTSNVPVSQPVQQQHDIMGGFSFEPQKIQTNSDPFNILGLDTRESPTSLNNNFQSNQQQPPKQSNQMDFGADLLGFGSTTISNQLSQNQNNNFMQGDLLGGFGGVQQKSQYIQQPQQNNNTSFKGYQNQQIELIMECTKLSNENTVVTARFNNKTGGLIENIQLQPAVMKHLKITEINPMSSTTLQPMAKGTVTQKMVILNTLPGQKGIVMKVKLTYSCSGQKLQFEQKIANFPPSLSGL